MNGRSHNDHWRSTPSDGDDTHDTDDHDQLNGSPLLDDEDQQYSEDSHRNTENGQQGNGRQHHSDDNDDDDDKSSRYGDGEDVEPDDDEDDNIDEAEQGEEQRQLKRAGPSGSERSGRSDLSAASHALAGKTATEHAESADANGLKSLVIVLKIGSSSLSTPNGEFLHLENVVKLADTIVELRKQGHSVILATSGAVSVGCLRLAMNRPKNLITKQAVAAVGQSRLMRVYDDIFESRRLAIAQVLLSRENLSKEHQYKNAKNTFVELLKLGVVPIVNENDTVAVEELRFGDNDTISALVASLVSADWLFLLTDVDALYSSDPRTDPDAKPVHVVHDIEKLSVKIGDAGSWGTGGMATKIQAARIATTAGVTCGIIRSDHLTNVRKMISGDETVGTKFVKCSQPVMGRKRWIAHGCAPLGTLVIDDAAKQSIIHKKSSLFAVGILQVKGDFQNHSNVIVQDKSGLELARGVVNYSSDDINTIRGYHSKQYEKMLGYRGPSEIINRENLALTLPSAHFPSCEPGVPSGNSPTTKVRQHPDLPPFTLYKEYNPKTDHAVAEFRSVDEKQGVQLVTMTHIASGITGHGNGNPNSSPAAKHMAGKDLIDQLKASHIIEEKQANKLIAEFNDFSLSKRKESDPSRPGDVGSPLPLNVPLKGIKDNIAPMKLGPRQVSSESQQASSTNARGRSDTGDSRAATLIEQGRTRQSRE